MSTLKEFSDHWLWGLWALFSRAFWFLEGHFRISLQSYKDIAIKEFKQIKWAKQRQRTERKECRVYVGECDRRIVRSRSAWAT